MISFEEFKKLDIRIGTILEAEKIEGADKLIKLIFDFGQEHRQIVAGIAEFYSPEVLVGKQMPVVVNLEPRIMRGYESNGMILAADQEGRPILLHPAEEIPPGSIVK